jgi:hypothetical protein
MRSFFNEFALVNAHPRMTESHAVLYTPAGLFIRARFCFHEALQSDVSVCLQTAAWRGNLRKHGAFLAEILRDQLANFRPLLSRVDKNEHGGGVVDGGDASNLLQF